MSYQPQQQPKLAGEIFILEIGDTFTASNLSPHRGEFRVIERWSQNGFCYYRCNASVFRNKDVDRGTIKKPIKKYCRFSCIMGKELRTRSIHSYFDFESLESVFARLKEEQSRRYPSSRSFMIESDQDSPEVVKSWGVEIEPGLQSPLRPFGCLHCKLFWPTKEDAYECCSDE